MNNIFVYIELENGAVADVSLELLTKGRELADELGVKLEAVVLGHGVAGIEKELAKYGADTVWVADDEIFAPFRTLPHTAVLCGLIRQEKPLSETAALNPDWVEWLMGFPRKWTDVSSGPPNQRESPVSPKTPRTAPYG